MWEKGRKCSLLSAVELESKGGTVRYPTAVDEQKMLK